MPICACQHCSQRIDFPEELAGQPIPCPTCGRETPLPATTAPTIRLPKTHPLTRAARAAADSPVAALASRIGAHINRVIVGKDKQVERVLIAYLAQGHILIEDVPGVAKTMLARALARSIDASFKRLQCTPDLLPTDITGAAVFNPKTTEFEFRPGPIFAQIVLADEINRATPRAQAALLEAMAETQVSVDGYRHALEPPFLLIATQNPIDHEGTFPLPEAQLDRFLMRLSLGYPSHDEEVSLMDLQQLEHPIDRLEPIATAQEVIEAQAAVRRLRVDAKVRDYIARIVRATRADDAIALGASPRASLALCRCTQALAAIRGYDFALPDDVKEIAPWVLAHRLIVKPESRLRRVSAADVLGRILDAVEVPVLAPG